MAGNHVFEQVGDDHRVWGATVNDLFMDPSGPWRPLGIRQTDASRKREGWGRAGEAARQPGRETMRWDVGGAIQRTEEDEDESRMKDGRKEEEVEPLRK